jgi:hypothetical protein
VLVKQCMAVDRRSCGKVDNWWDAELMQVVGLFRCPQASVIPTAGLWSMLLRRGHARRPSDFQV